MDKLNNLTLKDYFSLAILTGREQFLVFPERKEMLQTEWLDQNGTDYFTDQIFLKDKMVTLTCAIMTDDHSNFWICYEDFFAELLNSPVPQLYIHDHDKTYNVIYKSTANFKITLKRLKDVPKVFVKFDITLVVI